ncbi:predicted protein [Postia placenta Mad-698-R]|nr:predicted protein [Postia placenta Mad-698-R]
MANKLPLGSIVLYRPTRAILAITSGSQTAAPSNKERPPIVTPLCGALPLGQGQAGRRQGMDVDWWQHTIMVRTDAPTTALLPIPQDGSSLIRDAIRFTHDPLAVKSSDYPRLKSSYLWVGDDGEEVAESLVPNLRVISPYLRLDPPELTKLVESWNYWRRVRAPPSRKT